MHNTKRMNQMAELIRTTIATILKKSTSDPRLIPAVITSVDLSPDFRNATIFFTISDTSEESILATEKAFHKSIGFFRYQLSQSTELRYTPQLIFQYDRSIAYGERISSLLRDV